MTKLIRVEKNGVQIDVHPCALDEHIANGWVIAPVQPPAEPPVKAPKK